MHGPEAAPLIVTAALDARSTAVVQDLRTTYFPAHLNIVPAHLTLFHHLPGSRRPMLDATLGELCSTYRAIPFKSGGLRFLGRGVAIEIDATALVTLRRTLAKRWEPWLTPQDSQGFRPHVTIQNKVDPARARALLEALAATLPPLNGTIEALEVWHYRGGPWEFAGRHAFNLGQSTKP